MGIDEDTAVGQHAQSFEGLKLAHDLLWQYAHRLKQQRESWKGYAQQLEQALKEAQAHVCPDVHER